MQHTRPISPRAVLATSRAALLLGACGVLFACGDPGPQPIRETRDLAEARRVVPPNAPDWARFRLPAPGASSTPAGHPAQPATPAWDLPKGWVHRPTEQRPFNFVIDGDAELDCYLTAMPKMQMTVLANVDRWRGQMGLEAAGADGLAALPRRPMFGEQAYFVDVVGAYRGMGGAEPKAGWRLLGLIFEAQSEFVFVKLVGPDEKVAAQREAFLALAASMRRPSTPPEGERGMPSEYPVTDGGLAWSAPEGWVDKGRSGIREVTFEVPDAGIECWALFLAADGGGLDLNVNRWLGEVGQAPLGAEQIADLPRLRVLGQASVLVEGTGDYQGMGGPQTRGARLLGLICQLAGRSLFVKMVGPDAAVSAQRENFIRFCESLNLTP